MEKTSKADLIERLEMRNVAMDYTALWCPICLLCIIIPIEGDRKNSVMMHSGDKKCPWSLKEGHLAECLRDLKGETEK